MPRLDNPQRTILSQADFEQYPVWVWDDGHDRHQPISEVEPSTEDYETLFIKARFEADGHAFDGYLIGGETFYAFGLFVAGRKCLMNLNMPGSMEESLSEIFALLKCQPFQLFPLRFASSVRLKSGGTISGTLSW